MVKKSKKSKSKRTPLRQKYKILKKVKEHHKKKAKEAKKTLTKKKPAEKDPGIPSQWPFREQELALLEERRQRAIEEMEKKKQEKKDRQAKRKAGLLVDESMDGEGGEGGAEDMVALAAKAKKEEAEFEKRKKLKVAKEAGGALKDGSKRAFYREFQKVLEASDVVIEVLDARDPLGCRCLEVEKMVMRSGGHKRVVLLLNKIDLVPKEVAEKWLKYLREELPTVAFKCSTQSQKSNLGQQKGGAAAAASDAMQSSQCLGAETLLQLLKNYSRNQKLKTAVTVGVIGFPNVGKSSLINSLKRTRVANVGSTPGVTKAMQEIHLDKHVKLLDCPGIVFASSVGGGGMAEAALRNAVKVEQLEDPVAPVRQILRLCDAERLMSIFKVARFEDADEFVRSVAFARGKLKKGGVPDSKAAARLILKDWNEGKIPYYSLPPVRTANSEHASASIVQAWGKEFEMDQVGTDERAAVIAELPSMGEASAFTEVPASAPLTMDIDEMEAEQADGEDDGEEDEDEEEEEEEGEEEDDESGEAMKGVEAEAEGATLRHRPLGDGTNSHGGMELDKAKEVTRGRDYLQQNDKLYDADGILNPKKVKEQRKKAKKDAKKTPLAAKVKQAREKKEKKRKDEEEDAESDGSDFDFSKSFKSEAMDGVDGDDA